MDVSETIRTILVNALSLYVYLKQGNLVYKTILKGMSQIVNPYVVLDNIFRCTKIELLFRFKPKNQKEEVLMPDHQTEQTVREILEYRCPRYEQLPDIPLYSEQLVDMLSRMTAPLLGEESSHVITSSMINNYVKQKLIPPPEKKRYRRTHLSRLYCICLLKQVCSIQEIAEMLHVQEQSYPFPQAYDYFCTELELALQASFSSRDFSAPSAAVSVTPESELVRTAALSFACKLFTSKFLQLYPFPPQDRSKKCSD